MRAREECGCPPSQGEKPQEKPILLTPEPQTSSPQNCEEINLCDLSPPVCGTLLWQPEQMDAISNSSYSPILFYPHSLSAFSLLLALPLTQQTVRAVSLPILSLSYCPLGSNAHNCTCKSHGINMHQTESSLCNYKESS